MSVITISFIIFHFLLYIIFFSLKIILQNHTRMGIFLNGLLEPKISPLPSYSPPCFIKQRPLPTASNPFPLVGPRYSPSPSVSIRQTPLHFLRYNQFQISFCTPVLVNPDKSPTANANKTVPVRNGINAADAGKNHPSIFMLYAYCVSDIFIVMPFFSSYASTSRSSCELIMTITSSLCRSEKNETNCDKLAIRFKCFLELVFLTL